MGSGLDWSYKSHEASEEPGNWPLFLALRYPASFGGQLQRTGAPEMQAGAVSGPGRVPVSLQSASTPGLDDLGQRLTSVKCPWGT